MESRLAGTYARILDLAINCIFRLQAAEKRHKKPELTTTLLLSHLDTLRTTLSELQTWLTAKDFLGSQHQQLITVVDAVLASCHLLLGVLNDQISEREFEDGPLADHMSKARLTSSRNVTKACVGHLSNQTIALKLILMTFRWYE